MIKNKTTRKILSAAGCALCAVITVIGTFAGLCFALAGSTFGSEDFFSSLTEHSFVYDAGLQKFESEYAEQIIRKIDEDFVADVYVYFGDQYGDVSSVLRSCVDGDTVRELTSVYLKGIHTSLTTGAPEHRVAYPADRFVPLTDRIKPLVLADEEEIRREELEKGISGEDSTALSEAEIDQALARLRDRLAEQIDVYLNSFSSISFINREIDLVKLGYEKVFSRSAAKIAMSTSAAIPFAAAAAAAVGLWLLSGSGDRLKKTYNALAALWVGVVLYAIPMILFGAYDLPGRLLLGDSFFKLFVVALLNGVISRAFTLALSGLIVASAALIVSIAMILKRGNGSGRYEKAGADEESAGVFIAEDK